MRKRIDRMPKILAGLTVLALAAMALLGLHEHRVRADLEGMLPLGVEAKRVEYRWSRTEGFGPGGAEYGMVVFEMNDATVERLSRGGLEYLRSQPVSQGWALERPQAKRLLRRIYADWDSTPPKAFDRTGLSVSEPPIALQLLDEPEFSRDVPRDVLANAKALWRTPGAYHARARSNRVVVVAPAKRQVVVAYAG